ncbi:RNA polymerase sigma factor [Thalassoroseus pseudoceratinae]|uniref:RNA polymerase sigma factor n=1 Tax=Thalassoroseus pseudoceratinae TaxID=2713176 RepID=UPI001F0E6ECD|nr:sigma-70 family RNA polymerase sigma factor [Thalassoroseus pseudoceratinae]
MGRDHNSSGDSCSFATVPVNADDQRLITECLNGRTEAFGDLVLRHQNRLHNTLAKMLGSTEDARDISQEAFVLAFTKLDTFRGESAFYSWLFRIAYNVLVSRKRKKRRATTSLDAAREKAGVDPTDFHPEAHPSHSMELAEQQTQVRRALAELSEEYREVLVLKEMENLSYEEIAEIVGCPIGTVRSRIHRGRVELREKLRIILQMDGV